MRLIDADKLMKEIREVDFMADAEEMKVTHDTMMTGFFHGRVQGIVDHLPTAYDPDKIVEQLEIKKILAEGSDSRIRNKAFKEAIEIVKGGAV